MASPSNAAGRLLAFDPTLRRARNRTNKVEPDAGERYEDALQALLEVLDDEDVHLVDALDEAVAGLLAQASFLPPSRRR